MKKYVISSLLICFSQSVFADFACDNTTYVAIYALNQYTCDNGQFLPANFDECVACPDDNTCNGGTFDFDSQKFQGMHINNILTSTMNNACASNFPSALYAVYMPISVNCLPGYYLPANVDECTECPTNSICVGGTYTSNETTDQGIQSCTNDTFSPTGSSVCYPHRLHVGDDIVYVKSTKQTTPSVNIKIGDDIFYINMTTTRTRMNKDSSHYFHVDWDNNHYYVCDDTTCPYAE